MKCKCDNCGWECEESHLAGGLLGIPKMLERLTPGGVVPAGECPKCGCLSYLLKSPPLETYASLLADVLPILEEHNRTEGCENTLARVRAVLKPVGQVDEGPEDYTVILLYPDYASDTYGQETWCGHVQAVDAGAALEAARDEMIAENKKLGLEFESRDDLFPIALFQGKHDDLSSLCV